MQVAAWIPRGDTLVRLGGTRVDADLRGQTLLRAGGNVGECRSVLGDTDDPTRLRALDEYRKFLAQFPAAQRATSINAVTAPQPESCAVMGGNACTTPPRPFEHVLVRYQDPAGNPVYHDVVTDAQGCYQDMYIAVSGGDWNVTTFYKGNQCAGPVAAGIGLHVPLPALGDQDHDGLPDKDEVDGDADFDGIPNFLDPDSDGDGVIDGKEPPGDADQDGVDNVVDWDSNNNGIPDGTDPFPYRVCHHNRPLTRTVVVLVWILWIAAAVLLLIALAWRGPIVLLLALLLLLSAWLLVSWFCLNALYWPAAWVALLGALVAFIAWRYIKGP